MKVVKLEKFVIQSSGESYEGSTTTLAQAKQFLLKNFLSSDIDQLNIIDVREIIPLNQFKRLVGAEIPKGNLFVYFASNKEFSGPWAIEEIIENAKAFRWTAATKIVVARKIYYPQFKAEILV